MPERDGYAFKGWFTSETGGDTVTTNTAFNKATTVYAQWIFITDKMYIVTFDAHGGTVSPKSGVTGEDGKLLAPLPVPTREGYTFEGWFTETAAVTAGTVFTANTGVHAQWKIVHYKITFDAVGGTVSPSSDSTGSHWELADLPVPEREGYTFRGWYTSAEGGSEVTPSTPLVGDATIYAHWTSSDAHYTITFDAAGGTVSPATAETGEGYRLYWKGLKGFGLPTPERDGYTFNGWFTAEAGGTLVTYWTVFEADAVVYAHWTADVHGGFVTYGGEVYHTEVIGSQTWFARNLNYAGENGDMGVCYVDNYDYDNASEDCAIFGRLYSYDEAKSVCPVGWHLPSDDEWTELIDYAGSNSATKLKSPSYWYWQKDEYVGTDDFGFGALPGGQCNIQSDGELFCRWIRNFGLWWTSTAEADKWWIPRMNYYNEEVYRQPYGWSNVFLSVRCVKD